MFAFEILTSLEFCRWLSDMGIGVEEAAFLLKTTTETVKGYQEGYPTVTVKHSGLCRHLLFKKRGWFRRKQLESQNSI